MTRRSPRKNEKGRSMRERAHIEHDLLGVIQGALVEKHEDGTATVEFAGLHHLRGRHLSLEDIQKVEGDGETPNTPGRDG